MAGESHAPSRINVATAAKVTGRSEKTIRAWLAETPASLSVEWGDFRGGRRIGKRLIKGRSRLVDVQELKALHVARGGTAWHREHLPHLPTAIQRTLQREVRQLRQEVDELRECLSKLMSGPALH